MTRTLLIRLAAVAAAGALAVVLLTGRDGGRTLRAAFPSAINVVSGAEVRIGGLKVGTVREIELRDGRADLELGIDDDGAWPLRRGTQAAIRLGGTVSYANRYVELVPGPAGGPPLRDGDRLPARDASAPVEFDELFGVFDPPTREGLGELIDRGEATFARRGGALRRGLRSAGPGASEAGETFEALSDDPHALRTLLRTGAGVAGQLARREPALRALVDDAAATLDTIASSGDDVRATLRALPGALRDARGTLARTDDTLVRATPLLEELRPGARELRRTSAPLRRAVGTLATVAPDLQATLRRVRRGGPDIAGFLTEAVPQLEVLRPVLARAAPMAGCLRAYSPELAGFLASWAAFNTGYDASGRYAWLNGQVLPFPNTTPMPSRAVAEAFPSLRYSLVRPPGLSVGQPRLLPGCGVTQERQDPRNDPEARG